MKIYSLIFALTCVLFSSSAKDGKNSEIQIQFSIENVIIGNGSSSFDVKLVNRSQETLMVSKFGIWSLLSKTEFFRNEKAVKVKRREFLPTPPPVAEDFIIKAPRGETVVRISIASMRIVVDNKPAIPLTLKYKSSGLVGALASGGDKFVWIRVDVGGQVRIKLHQEVRSQITGVAVGLPVE